MSNSSSPITAEDFTRAAIDATTAQKINAEVQRRRQTDPKFSTDDLRREICHAGVTTSHGIAERVAQPTVAAVSIEDFRTAAINAKSAQKISAAVASRREKIPTFTTEDLRRELIAIPQSAPAAVVVTPEAFGAAAAGVLASLDDALRRRGATPAAPAKNPVVHKMRADGCQCNAAPQIHQHWMHEIVIAQLKAEGVIRGSKRYKAEYVRRLNRPRSVKWQSDAAVPQQRDNEAA